MSYELWVEVMTRHIPVLLSEAIEALHLESGETAVDATLGGGGHTRAMLSRVLPGGRVVAFDTDGQAIERFLRNAETDALLREAIGEGSLIVKQVNFSHFGEALESLGVGRVDAVFADFGFSSDQMDDPSRGFSFRENGPLDMRLDGTQETTAADIVNRYEESDLIRILRLYGDEPKARKIARAIVVRRKSDAFRTTTDLAEIVSGCFSEEHRRRMKVHPATKTFQAIRMEVNGELSAIEAFLAQGVERLDHGGRIAVITFHSGEDGLVKRTFSELSKGCTCPPELPKCVCGNRPLLRLGRPRYVAPDGKECAANPRARSAKLRWAERI